MEQRKRVILCVDDDADILDSLRLILEGNGYEAVLAGTAEEGLRAYKESKPDLIIADLMMEEVDSGTDLVKEVRALGGAEPIYMLSSVGDMLNAQTSYAQLGLSGVLQKPIRIDTLLTILRDRLG